MRPVDDTGAAKRLESGLPLVDIPPSGSRQESAATEVAETPGPGGCWQCPSLPCGSRAEQEAEKKAPCPGLGLFYTLLSAFLFSVGSLFVKKVQDIHAVEISAFRCVFQMLIIIPCLIYRKYKKMNSSGLHPKGHETAQGLIKAQRNGTNITSEVCNQTRHSL
ncbi:solute carrier family 35 member G1 isoform X4 [Phocoena phocoena]|uniref:solute carrier family 35 member G1 isoform X4 n=1 Tax=Phocoena phocoena TaxID=9742 RepID=UPI0033074539